MDSLYERYEKIRNLRGYTDYRVTKMAEIKGTATISNWKNGKYQPKDDKMKKIAEALEVPVEFLTGEIDSFPCKECGHYYNPLDEESSNAHKFVHYNFSIAKSEYPFLENIFSANANLKKCTAIIGNSNLTDDEIIESIKHYAELLFSIELSKYDYQLNILDYEEFAKEKISTYLNADWISQEVKDTLTETYHVDLDYVKTYGNDSLLIEVSKKPTIMNIIRYLNLLNDDTLSILETQAKALADTSQAKPVGIVYAPTSPSLVPFPQYPTVTNKDIDEFAARNAKKKFTREEIAEMLHEMKQEDE